MSQPEAKRPITHVIWFTINIFSLVLSPFYLIGELTGFHTSAGKDLPEFDGWFLLYYIVTAASGYLGYLLLPKNKYLTFVNAIKWRIYAGVMLSIFHWVTVAYITQGWYQVYWPDTIFQSLLFLGFLAFVGFLVWLVQTMFPTNKTKESEHDSGSPFHNTHARQSPPGVYENQRKSIISQKGWALICAAGVFVVSIVVIAIYHTYLNANRFALEKGNDGRVYKIDKKSGELVLLAGNREVLVKKTTPPLSESPRDRAIRLAKNSRSLSNNSSFSSINHDVIINNLNTMKGSLKIIGWSADCVDEQTYLVKFEFENSGDLLRWVFEVKIMEEIVRTVGGDKELEEKYLSTHQDKKTEYGMKRTSPLLGLPVD